MPQIENDLRRSGGGAANSDRVESVLGYARVDRHRDKGTSLQSGGNGPYESGMETRVSRLEGAHDGIKQSQSILVMSVMGLAGIFLALAAIMVTLQIFTYGHVDAVDAHVTRLESKVDALPGVISEEFRAMRAEMSAQTSAIANSITAAKSQAPSAPPPAPAKP